MYIRGYQKVLKKIFYAHVILHKHYSLHRSLLQHSFDFIPYIIKTAPWYTICAGGTGGEGPESWTPSLKPPRQSSTNIVLGSNTHLTVGPDHNCWGCENWRDSTFEKRRRLIRAGARRLRLDCAIFTHKHTYIDIHIYIHIYAHPV